MSWHLQFLRSLSQKAFIGWNTGVPRPCGEPCLSLSFWHYVVQAGLTYPIVTWPGPDGFKYSWSPLPLTTRIDLRWTQEQIWATRKGHLRICAGTARGDHPSSPRQHSSRQAMSSQLKASSCLVWKGKQRWEWDRTMCRAQRWSQHYKGGSERERGCAGHSTGITGPGTAWTHRGSSEPFNFRIQDLSSPPSSFA